MLQIKELKKNFADRVLFKNCSLNVNKGEKIALIGPNGTGKTTIFRVIMGIESCDSGEIILEKNTKIGFLPQEIDAIRGSILLDEVMQCSDEISDLQRKIKEIEIRLSELNVSGHEQLLNEYSRLQSRFEQLGGYDQEDHKAKRILIGLGFRESDFTRATDEFSGGWMMRIALAKLLLSLPELMLMDEPTNHLDLKALLWFQEYILSYKGTLIFTSHDIDFINNVSTRVVDIDEGELISYNGDYDYYIEEKNKRKELLISAFKNQEQKIKQTQEFIDRFRAKASKAKSVQSKIKVLDKMEKIVISRERKKARFNFPQPLRSGKDVMTLKNIYKSYGDNKVYENIDFKICRGNKIVLIGQNGAGKSTLLKILAGVLDIDSGEREAGHNVITGYYPQHRLDILNPDKTCLENIEEVSINNLQTDMRKLLGIFLFSGDAVYKKVSVLSGGEKSRLVMAKILANPANFLLMDEPTNHLDIPSRNILIEALNAFTGTLCFISHDVHFIRHVATGVIEVENGRLQFYPEGYDYYVYKKSLDRKASEPAVSDKIESYSRKIPEKHKIKNKSCKQEDEKKVLGRKIAEIEKQLGRMSARFDELNKILSDPSTYMDKNFVSFVKEHKTLQGDIDKLTLEWESYIERLEACDKKS